MKRCSKCSRELDESCFYAQKDCKNGLAPHCKDCALANAKMYRLLSLDKRRAQDRAYDVAHKEYRRMLKKAWREKNPAKDRASQTLRNAVARGKMKRSTVCEVCGLGGKIHGHHPDYSKPLEVQWLCIRCHERAHHDTGTRT